MLRFFIVFSLGFYFAFCGPECGEETYKFGLTTEEQNLVLKLHNEYRRKLMNGMVKDQPKACDVKDLTYDSSLSHGAREAVNQCKMKHKVKKDERFPNVGQNLYSEYNSELRKGINWTKCVESWYEEYENYDYDNKKSSNGKQIGHYTQVISAHSTKIGCDCVHFKDNSFYKTLVACNYGPGGNIIGKAPYKTDCSASAGTTTAGKKDAGSDES